MSDCIARITALSKTLGKYEGRADEFYKYAQQAVDAARKSGSAFDEQAVVDEAMRSFIARLVKEAEMQKWHAALTYQVKSGFKSLMDGMTNKELVDFVQHIMIPQDGRGRFKGAVEVKAVTLHHIAMTHFVQGLERQGLLRNNAMQFLRKDLNANEIMRASYDKNAVVSKEARIIANAMEDTADYMRRQANRYGADIAKMPGYLFRQSHDRYKIQKATAKGWAEFIVDLLDEQRTFGGKLTRPQKIEHLLKSWDTIVTGTNIVEATKDLSSPPGFKGPASIAKQMSHSRNLHFKDGDAAYSYMKEFGYPDVGNAFIGGLEMMSRNVAAMMHLGPNAKNTLLGKGGIVEMAKTRLRGDDKFINKIDENKLDLQFDEVLGTNSIMPADGFGGMLARTANWVRNVSTSAVLGGVSITSLSDVGTSVARLGEFGVPLAQAHADMITGMFEGRRKGEVREIADSLNIGIEHLMDSSSARTMGEGARNGQGAPLVAKLFHITGMNWLTDTMKASAGLSVSNYIAKQVTKSFDSLKQAAKEELNGYGITKEMWPNLKDAVRDVDGKVYIDAKNIKDPNTQLLFQTFITGFVNSAVLTPGARTRLMMRSSRSRGEALTEMSMFFFHLKSYGITYAREILSRGIVNRASGKTPSSIKGKMKEYISDGRFFYTAHLLSSMIVYGTLVTMLKDVAKGQKPKADGSTVWRVRFLWRHS